MYFIPIKWKFKGKLSLAIKIRLVCLTHWANYIKLILYSSLLQAQMLILYRKSKGYDFFSNCGFLSFLKNKAAENETATYCFKFPFCCCSVSKSCPTLCTPVDCNMPCSPVLHYLPKFSQILPHWVSDAI